MISAHPDCPDSPKSTEEVNVNDETLSPFTVAEASPPVEGERGVKVSLERMELVGDKK